MRETLITTKSTSFLSGLCVCCRGVSRHGHGMDVLQGVRGVLRVVLGLIVYAFTTGLEILGGEQEPPPMVADTFLPCLQELIYCIAREARKQLRQFVAPGVLVVRMSPADLELVL